MAKSVKKQELVVEKQPITESSLSKLGKPAGGVLTSKNKCEGIANSLDKYYDELVRSKVNKMEHCSEDDHKDGCGCGGGSGSSKPKVDLIVLIDTSGSMNSIAITVSDAASAAIEKAKSKCESDLKVTYLGVDGSSGAPSPDGTMPGTLFGQSHVDYLSSPPISYAGPFTTDSPGYPGEQGANAIEDLSKYNNWREGACRAIFYISDEELDGSNPRGDHSNEDTATAAAIATANANEVTVFAHHITQLHYPGDTSTNWNLIEQNYKDLCGQTGGLAFIDNIITTDHYAELLEKVICSACGGCKSLEIPAAAPCFSVSWGDSDCDCMETNDFEVLTITACNCYSNISFDNLMIGKIALLDPSGKPVALLPDGSPSVEVHPVGGICFGSLGPCKDNKPTCRTREIVLYSRGAIAGKYQLKFEGICFSISMAGSTEACFQFNLCKD